MKELKNKIVRGKGEYMNKEFFYKRFKNWSIGIYSYWFWNYEVLPFFGIANLHIGFITISWDIKSGELI